MLIGDYLGTYTQLLSAVWGLWQYPTTRGKHFLFHSSAMLKEPVSPAHIYFPMGLSQIHLDDGY